MPAPTTAPVLSTPSDDLFSAPPPEATSNLHLDAPDFETLYEIPRTVTELRGGGFSRVALQFPDHLLPDSTRVYSLLSSSLPETAKLFILADTSYSPCCIDEVDAEHCDADVIVHYGRACLSPTKRLPVVYVFTSNALDLDAAIQGFEKTYSTDSKVIVMADVTYSSHTTPLVAALRSHGYTNIYGTDMTHSPGSLLPNRTLPADITTEDQLRSYALFHISEPLPTLQLLLSSRVRSFHYFSAPSGTVHSATSTPMMRRRYALLSHARAAGIVGILINTLNIPTALPMISSLKMRIAAAGKKSYLVVVGKVNIEKVANFSEVECWVGIGCWEQGVVGGVEGRGWWRPVVTPWELGVALGEREWGVGGWVVDMGEVLAATKDEADKDQEVNSDEDAPPEFDLRTGRYISTTRPLGQRRKKTTIEIRDQTPASSALTKTSRDKDVVLVGGVVSPAAKFLKEQRTWNGLGSDFEGAEDGGALVEEGRGGVARGYMVGDGEKH